MTDKKEDALDVLIEALKKKEQELDVKSKAMVINGVDVSGWIKGYPSDLCHEEWFIAETNYGDRLVLKALDKDNTYDFKTADETWILKENIEKWMPFPDSDYFHPVEILEKQSARKEERIYELEQKLLQVVELAGNSGNKNPIENCWTLLNKCNSCCEKLDCGLQNPFNRLRQIKQIAQREL